MTYCQVCEEDQRAPPGSDFDYYQPPRFADRDLCVREADGKIVIEHVCKPCWNRSPVYGLHPSIKEEE